MAVDMFLEFEDKDLKGESKDKVHKNEIDIFEYQSNFLLTTRRSLRGPRRSESTVGFQFSYLKGVRHVN